MNQLNGLISTQLANITDQDRNNAIESSVQVAQAYGDDRPLENRAPLNMVAHDLSGEQY